MRNVDFHCLDCGQDTGHHGLREYYMLRDAIWKKICNIRGMLCIGCVERRLGRVLTRSDFTACPLNNPRDPQDAFSKRLRLRLGYRDA